MLLHIHRWKVIKAFPGKAYAADKRIADGHQCSCGARKIKKTDNWDVYGDPMSCQVAYDWANAKPAGVHKLRIFAGGKP